MKKLDNIVLHQIMDDLKAGHAYGIDRIWNYYTHERYDYPFFDKALFLSPATGNIVWCHFGQSANKCTFKDLAWIIETIFETTPSEFRRKYILDVQSTIGNSIDY